MRNGARASLAVLAVLLVSLPPSYAEAPGFVPIQLTAKPIQNFLLGSSRTHFGELDFRGGLQLTSTDPDFGSLSGLDIGADGKTLYAIADNGFWFTAQLVEDGGHLVGLIDGKLAPILDRNGKIVSTKRLGDAEGLRLRTVNGRAAALVSFEQVNNVREFLADPDFASAVSRPLKLPPMVSGMKPNKGLEAIAVATPAADLDGAIVLVAERSPDKAGNNRAWIVGGAKEGAFSVTRSDGFDVTDATFIANGDLLILERKVGFPSGLYMRIRRFTGTDIKPGATVDGTTLVEADLRYQIDNMEGMAVHAGANGETLIDIVSDNNQGMLQRTLLLQFALP